MSKKYIQNVVIAVHGSKIRTVHLGMLGEFLFSQHTDSLLKSFPVSFSLLVFNFAGAFNDLLHLQVCVVCFLILSTSWSRSGFKKNQQDMEKAGFGKQSTDLVDNIDQARSE